MQFRESEDYEDNADAYNGNSERRDIDTDKYNNDVEKGENAEKDSEWKNKCSSSTGFIKKKAINDNDKETNDTGYYDERFDNKMHWIAYELELNVYS